MLKNKDSEIYKGRLIEYSYEEEQGWRWDVWTLEGQNKGEHHSNEKGYIRDDVAADEAKKWIDNKCFSDPDAVFEELFEKITHLYESGSIDISHLRNLRDKLSDLINTVE